LFPAAKNGDTLTAIKRDFTSPADPTSVFSLSWFSGAIEFVGGALVVIGLFSRLSAFIMSGEMAFAFFTSHACASQFFSD